MRIKILLAYQIAILEHLHFVSEEKIAPGIIQAQKYPGLSLSVFERTLTQQFALGR
jgi:hypothetical protein